MLSWFTVGTWQTVKAMMWESDKDHHQADWLQPGDNERQHNSPSPITGDVMT